MTSYQLRRFMFSSLGSAYFGHFLPHIIGELVCISRRLRVSQQQLQWLKLEAGHSNSGQMRSRSRQNQTYTLTDSNIPFILSTPRLVNANPPPKTVIASSIPH